MAAVGKTLAGLMILSLASCQLFFPTQVSFQNATSTYTFLEIKLGSADYTAELSPGQQSSFLGVSPGSYTLYTKGIDGILYAWPVPQSIAGGYSYTLIFSVNTTTNSLVYSTYIALEK